MRPFGAQSYNNRLKAGQSGIAYMHLIFDNKQAIPLDITHQIEIMFLDKNNIITEEVAPTEVNILEPNNY